MRSPNELNCSRGYEWSLMKEAVKRNPNITLYGSLSGKEKKTKTIGFLHP